VVRDAGDFGRRQHGPALARQRITINRPMDFTRRQA
jgi:hypothetical protein